MVSRRIILVGSHVDPWLPEVSFASSQCFAKY